MPKRKTKQKYKPLSDATPEEIQEAMQMRSYWLTDELEGHTEGGAFAEPFLPEPAIEYFPKRAYLKLSSPNCKWKLKEGTKLSTLFINVMRSDMAHKLREYIDQDKPNVAIGCRMIVAGFRDMRIFFGLFRILRIPITSTSGHCLGKGSRSLWEWKTVLTLRPARSGTENFQIWG